MIAFLYSLTMPWETSVTNKKNYLFINAHKETLEVTPLWVSKEKLFRKLSIKCPRNIPKRPLLGKLFRKDLTREVILENLAKFSCRLSKHFWMAVSGSSWFFQIYIFSWERAKASPFVIFKINISFIFPKNFIEIYQVVKKIWGFSPSILTTLILFFSIFCLCYKKNYWRQHIKMTAVF